MVQLFTRQHESRARVRRSQPQEPRLADDRERVRSRVSFPRSRQSARSTIGIILWVGGGEAMHRVVRLGTLFAFIEYAQDVLPAAARRFLQIHDAAVGAGRDRADRGADGEPASDRKSGPRRAIRAPCAARSSSTTSASPTGAASRCCGTQLHRRAGPEDRDRRRDRLRQIHHHQAAQPLLRRQRRTHPGRRRRRARVGPAALRRAIGLVQQDVFLFAGDIFDNVRLRRIDLARPRCARRSRRAQALDFVERLPAGLHEEFRERGANLSAGQRQLLSFARALAYDPRVLVMDEATSSVDSETESLVQRRARRSCSKDRTALVDRPSPLDHRARRPHPGAEPGRAARERHPRGTARPPRPVSPSVRAAVCDRGRAHASGRGLRPWRRPPQCARLPSRYVLAVERLALAGCEAGYIAQRGLRGGLLAVAPKADRHGARARRPAAPRSAPSSKPCSRCASSRRDRLGLNVGHAYSSISEVDKGAIAVGA